ncbi:MAG TPA: hypothetical protein VMM79_14330 [Longimicrobiales bacterium]|nr:hypothetical protein [Longimicrobiales bacterium]
MAAGIVYVVARADMKQFRQEMKRGAEQTGDLAGVELMKSLRTSMNARIGSAREALTRGLIDKNEFRRLSQDAAKEFNKGVLAELKRLRAAGQQNTAEFQQLQRSLKSVGTTGRAAGREGAAGINLMSKAAGQLKVLLGSLAVFFGAAAISRFFRASLKEAQEATQIWALLDNAVTNAGESYAAVLPQIRASAAAFQRSTRFGDEDFARALTEVLTITNDYAQALRNMDVVLDLAAAKHIDLKTAAQLVGRALVGDTGTLKRYGIVVAEGADAVEVMRERFKGAAEKEGKSLGARIVQLTNFWADFKEEVGRAVFETDAATGSMESLVDVLQTATDWVAANREEINQLVTKLAEATVGVGKLIVKLVELSEHSPGKLGARIHDALRDIPGVLSPGATFARGGLGVPTPRRDRTAEAATAAADVAAIEELTEAEKKRAEELAKALKEQADAAGQLSTALAQVRAEAEATAAIGLADGVEIPDSVVASLKEIVGLEQQISRLRDLRAKAGAQADPSADADIASEQARLDALKATVAETLGDIKTRLAEIPAVAVTMANSIGTALAQIEPQVTSIINEIAAVEAAQAELQKAILTGDEARQQAATASLRERENELRRAVASMVTALERAGVPAELLDSLIADINKGLSSINVKVEPAAAAIEDGFAEAARSAELLLRGLLSVADAIGGISDSTRQALTGAIDLVAGLGQVQAATTALGKLGGIGAIAGAAIGIGSALFGGDDQEREERKTREDNLRQIVRMTDDLARLNDVIGPLVSAVEQAERALAAIAARAGITGVDGVAGARSRQAELQAERDRLQARRGGAGQFERTGIDLQLQVINEQLAILDDALGAFNEQAEQLAQNFRDNLALRTLELTATDDVIAAKKLEIDQARELKDVLAAVAAGVLTDADVQALRDFHQLQKDIAAEQAEQAKRHAIEDAGIRKLEAQGLTRTAALRRLLIDHERQLAEARKRGADAAELAALAEAQLAEKRAFVESFINDIVRSAAERRGDTDTIVALDQANVLKAFADAQTVLDELAATGDITEDQFLHMSGILRDELGPAMQAVADAAQEAAAALKSNIEQGIEDFTDPDGARARSVGRQADEWRDEARRVYSGDELAEVLKSIDKWEGLALAALEDSATELGKIAPAVQGASEVTRQITTISEATAQGMVGILRQQLALDRERNTLLKQITAGSGLAASTGGFSPQQQAGFRGQPVPTAAVQAGPTTLNMGGFTLDLDIANRSGPILNAQHLIALLKRPEVMAQINQQLARSFGADERRAGLARRN